MMSGDEFYGDDVTSYVADPLAAADFILDQLRDASPCPKCAAPDPARVDAAGCSECTEYPRCYLCRRWTFGDELNVSLDGAIRGVCSVCWERGEEAVLIPLDYSEDDDA